MRPACSLVYTTRDMVIVDNTHRHVTDASRKYLFRYGRRSVTIKRDTKPFILKTEARAIYYYSISSLANTFSA